MRARIGFVLFTVVFFIVTLAVMLMARLTRLLQGMSRSFSIMRERFARGTRMVTKKFTVAAWK